MNDGQKNLKDTQFLPSLSLKDTPIEITYNKTNKLITALYMVTDIMDTNEPIRERLRFLGTKILSDIFALRTSYSFYRTNLLLSDIGQVISFLDISATVGLVSEMNTNILKKEFFELKKTLEDTVKNRKENNLENLFDGLPSDYDLSFPLPDKTPLFEVKNPIRTSFNYKGHSKGHDYIGQRKTTRIGVQKGGTLLKALSDKISDISKENHNKNLKIDKSARREEIIKLIKDKPRGLTISDIKNNSQGILKDTGEKTLQRELSSLVAENVLKKVGEKRWSRYLLV